MRYRSGSWIVLMALLWVADATAAKPNPEEFAVPLQAAPTVLRSTPPGSVRLRPVKDELTGQPALRAGTAQAAIAAAVGQRAAGCRMIRFGASFGWVATGVATYPASDNPVALNRSRQEARFKAFTDAGARLAGCWSGLAPEARRRIAESLEQSDAIRLALINLAFTEADKQEQALRILARGYVAYSVEHDAGQRAIYVNLVTTPKTAARLTRPAPDAVEAVSLQEGLRQAHAEIAAGLIPPAGNRLIEVNATGELALVGYAANLIGAHPDPAAQDKLRVDAEKIATRRAADALLGLASGDATWQAGLDEASRSDIVAFGGGYAEGEPSVLRFGQIRDLAMTGVKDDAGMEALREGRLPSAAATKRFDGEDRVAVAVTYAPLIKKREPKPAPPPERASNSTPGAPARTAKPAASPVNAPPTAPAASPTSATAPPSPPAAPPASETPPKAEPAPTPAASPAASPAEPPGTDAGDAKPAEAR